MTDMIKPAFHAMSFEEIGNWVVKHNVVNGEEVFDEDFAAIEEMYEDGQEAGMLRRWWVYNLAVAVSNMEEIV